MEIDLPKLTKTINYLNNAILTLTSSWGASSNSLKWAYSSRF